MANLLEKIISKLKKDSTYRIETKYTFRQLTISVYYRALQVFRGFKYYLFMKEMNGFCFVGRRVKVEHAYMVKAGKNLILEDDVFINGLSENGIIFGNNVSIGKKGILIGSAIISQKGVGIKLGNNVGINSSCYIGGQGGVLIGNDVIIGPNVSIFSENHIYIGNNIPIRKQGESRKGVKINNNCWIGAGAIILDGVEIGEGCVVAAGSVVTKSFSSNLVIGGVPAKVIKKRFE